MGKDLSIVMNLRKRILLLLIILGVVVLAYFFGLSFSIPELNAVAIIMALIAFIFLPRCCSDFQPKWFFDLIRVVGWFFSPILIIIVAFSLTTKKIENVSNSEYCTQSYYGFVGTDGGTELCAYKRFGIIDIKIGCHRSSDMYQSPKDIMNIHTICKDKKIIKI